MQALNRVLGHVRLSLVVSAGVVSALAGEVRGRTWDRLLEGNSPTAVADGGVLRADEVSRLAGRQVPLCMIGDSITWAEQGDCWRKWLVRKVPAVAFVGTHTACLGFSHAGEGGNSTLGVLSRVDDRYRVPDCPYYHLMIGINDSSAAACEADVPRVASNTVASIWKIVDRLLARSTTRRVFLGSILPCRLARRPYRDAAGSKANELMRAELGRRYPADRVSWVEYEKPLRRDLAAWLGTGDFLHPHDGGYRTLADLLAPEIAAIVPVAPAQDGSSAARPAFGVRVDNLWEAEKNISRPLLPGWYVLSFTAPKAGRYKAHLRNRGAAPDSTFDKTFDLEQKTGGRCEFAFMTGYDGYGYRVTPFVLDVTDGEGRPVPVTEVQVEKMRPTRKASHYTRETFVDTCSPIGPGELLVPDETAAPAGSPIGGNVQ